MELLIKVIYVLILDFMLKGLISLESYTFVIFLNTIYNSNIIVFEKNFHYPMYGETYYKENKMEKCSSYV